MSKHLFALYLEDYSSDKKELIIKNPLIYHRITRVLRLSENEELIIFNKKFNVLSKIKIIDKKTIILVLGQANKNLEVKPKITLAIGMLRKENFEEIVYSSVELGVNEIQPLITDKSQKSKITEKDRERFMRIMISAAEQSKNFCLPVLHELITLDNFLEINLNNHKIYFDVEGQNLASFAQTINKQEANQSFCLLFGPEGDFSEEEKEQIKKDGFALARLTPTILRATQAVVVGAGLFRSLFN